MSSITSPNTMSQNLEDVIVPFVSSPTSPNTPGRKGSRHANPVSPAASADFSDDSSIPTPRNRMNPPAYSPNPASGEVQTVAPTSTEDLPGGHKHEYGASVDSRSWGAIPEEDEVVNGTGVGTGIATQGSPLEPRHPRGGWGGSTVAGSSEPDNGTVYDDDGSEAHLPSAAAYPRHPKDSLSDIVAGVRAGYL